MYLYLNCLSHVKKRALTVGRSAETSGLLWLNVRHSKWPNLRPFRLCWILPTLSLICLLTYGGPPSWLIWMCIRLEGAGRFQYYKKDAELYPFRMVWHLAEAEVNEKILLNPEETELVAVVHSNKSAFHFILWLKKNWRTELGYIVQPAMHIWKVPMVKVTNSNPWMSLVCGSLGYNKRIHGTTCGCCLQSCDRLCVDL